MCYSWGKRAAHNRAQIIYYLAENLEQRRMEFAQCLMSLTGSTEEAGLHEVDLSIKRLFHWAAYADKYGGTVQVCSKTKTDVDLCKLWFVKIGSLCELISDF